MENYEKNFWNHKYSQIYVESDIQAHPRTKKILSKLKYENITIISHYKDVFCKNNQSYLAQRNSPQIIIAKKNEQYIYEGSQMCDNYGYDNFFYTFDAMNCIYQCEYCYLQGMYPSANLVIFVNLEDTFKEIENMLLLSEKSAGINENALCTNINENESSIYINDNSRAQIAYICISYDTDLLAIESITGFVKDWIKFAALHPDIIIELRTKSSNFNLISKEIAIPNFILAWSISPQYVIENYEKQTPSLKTRLDAMKQAIENGWKVRLCIDPVIHIDNWKSNYFDLYEAIISKIEISKLESASVGVFRVPKENLKSMRKTYPDSKLLAYPYTLSAGGWTYNEALKNEMISYISGLFDA